MLAVACDFLGNRDRAEKLHKHAIEQVEALDQPEPRAIVYGNAGISSYVAGEPRAALALLKRSLEERDALNMSDRTNGLFWVGRILLDLGQLDEAERYLADSLALAEKSQHPLHQSLCLWGLGLLHARRDDMSAARDAHLRGLRIAEESGAYETRARNLHALTELALAAGDSEGAVRRARETIEAMGNQIGGAGGSEAAMARALRADAFAACVRVGLASGDTAQASFMIESARAGALMEAFGASRGVEAAILPEGLRGELTQTRADAQEAWAAVRWAGRGDDLKAARQAKKRAREAEIRWLEVISRIQRTAKAAASVTYPRADELAVIQRRLAPGEVLVTYVLLPGDAYALVTERDRARMVLLGPTERIEAACTALQDAEQDAMPDAAPLRRLVIEPLKLPKGTKRLLISPDGQLAYAPFALLAPDHVLAHIPSGTVYGMLRDAGMPSGRGILAVGDPDYSGTSFSRLAETRREVETIGTVTLLGTQASEARLRQRLAGEQRWRAIHLACHGVVDTERPALSAVVLTAGDEHDGYLRAGEIPGLRLNADLVVLSACETAVGRIFRAEGVVGLTRACMLGGAARVIVSLWKVDDAATQALMIKFYELWHPRAKAGGPDPVDGAAGRGLGAAAALKAAQEYVQGHAKWKHPEYWAAWQLWGIPD